MEQHNDARIRRARQRTETAKRHVSQLSVLITASSLAATGLLVGQMRHSSTPSPKPSPPPTSTLPTAPTSSTTPISTTPSSTSTTSSSPGSTTTIPPTNTTSSTTLPISGGS